MSVGGHLVQLGKQARQVVLEPLGHGVLALRILGGLGLLVLVLHVTDVLRPHVHLGGLHVALTSKVELLRQVALNCAALGDGRLAVHVEQGDAACSG